MSDVTREELEAEVNRLTDAVDDAYDEMRWAEDRAEDAANEFDDLSYELSDAERDLAIFDEIDADD